MTLFDLILCVLTVKWHSFAPFKEDFQLIHSWNNNIFSYSRLFHNFFLFNLTSVQSAAFEQCERGQQVSFRNYHEFFTLIRTLNVWQHINQVEQQIDNNRQQRLEACVPYATNIQLEGNVSKTSVVSNIKVPCWTSDPNHSMGMECPAMLSWVFVTLDFVVILVKPKYQICETTGIRISRKIRRERAICRILLQKVHEDHVS